MSENDIELSQKDMEWAGEVADQVFRRHFMEGGSTFGQYGIDVARAMLRAERKRLRVTPKPTPDIRGGNYDGKVGMHYVTLNGDPVYFAKDSRDSLMFAAELKARLTNPLAPA